MSAAEALGKAVIADRRLHADAVAGWLADASTDLKAPNLAAGLRWLSRCAAAKSRVVLATRNLHVLEQADLSNRYRADALLGGARDLALSQNERHELELMNAQRELGEATELLEIAERVARLLERPRAKPEAKPDTSTLGVPGAKFGVQQGGKR